MSALGQERTILEEHHHDNFRAQSGLRRMLPSRLTVDTENVPRIRD